MDRLPDLGALRTELRASGAFEHRELESWLKLALFLAGIGGCLAAIATLGWIAVPLIPVASVLCASTAMLGHEGSHLGFSTSPVRNALLVHIAFPLFSGLGALYWREKHDRLHHGHPNVQGVDPDIRPFPFVSSRADHERCGPARRWFQRNLQRWLFWPMSILMAVSMRGSSIIYLTRYPRRHGIDRAWLLDAGCLTVHYGTWLLAASLIWGPLAAFAVYLSVWGLVGCCLALVFAPAHIGLPITEGQHPDWLHQVETTRNLELPRVVSFFFIGLDYQVEHHLFPKIPHQSLPSAGRLVRAWCRRQGVPYQSAPYPAALLDSMRFMASAWDRPSTDPSAVRQTLRQSG